jgi:5'-AMP-activated protein kinase catalytic alpha subunit
MATIGKYNLLKLIGTGSFGKVYLGEHMDTGKRYAIKIIQTSKGKNPDEVSENAQKEIEISCAMNHKNIIKVYDSSTSELLTSSSGKQKEVYYIATEYALKGELFDLILQTQKLSEEIARYYFIQLLDSLEYLHLNGVHHCDIKLNNLLIDGDYNLKLTDFGLSSIKLTNETKKGSEEYMAPEIHSGKCYNGPLVDIFAAGVVLFVMVFGEMPFSKAEPSDIEYRVLAGNKPDVFWKIQFKKMESDFKPSESIIELLTMMLCYYPWERPSLAEITSHGWFKQINTVTNTQVISEFEHRIMKLKENDEQN